MKGCVFSAVGTCGQRCTTLRRLMVVNEHFDAFAARMVGAYKSLKIGSPLDKDVLVGPLHSKAQIKQFTEGIAEAQRQGGKLLCGGDVLLGLLTM